MIFLPDKPCPVLHKVTSASWEMFFCFVFLLSLVYLIIIFVFILLVSAFLSVVQFSFFTKTSFRL